jgi:hypothetical protein
MKNNFTVDEVRSNILFHRAASRQWLQMFNFAKGKHAKAEFEQKAIYHCNKLLSWQATYEKITGSPYLPDPEPNRDPPITIKDVRHEK